MNYANPFSLSFHGSYPNPKENPSILTSFLSQNQSIRSAQSIPTKLSFISQQQFKKKDLISPRSKIVTLHEDRKFEKRNIERVKYVSEHSTTPYLFISKKHPQIHIPMFPKLSPEPKIQVHRMPYINIMTEPTATIEEHSDEGRSNYEKSLDDDKQLIFNQSNNLLQASLISNNQEESLSPNKLSLKSRFKLAVQKSFRQPPRKSIFTLLISHEFNTHTENERKSIHKKFEPGNSILASKITFIKKYQSKQSCISYRDIKNQSNFHNVEQFNISSQAFQRKISLIHNTNSRNLIQNESFSLLPKSSRKSAIISKFQSNFLIGITDKKNEKLQFQEGDEKQSQNDQIHFQRVQINITVTFDNVDKTVYQFNKPKHIYEQNNIINEDQSQLKNLSSKLTQKIVPNTLQPQTNQIQLVSTKKLDFNSSFIDQKTKRQSRLSIQYGGAQEEVLKFDSKNQFNKSGLFFRVYYQNKLYKLTQKSNYTKENLQEIEQSFRPNFCSVNSNTIMNNVYTIMSTTEYGIRQRKVTNESITDKIQFLGIKLSKYQIEFERQIFNYNDETSLDDSDFSEDSESDVSLDKFLESPLNLNKPLDKKKKTSKGLKTLLETSQQQQNQNQFMNDQPTDQKQLSTGTLVLIKKIRKAFKISLFIQPIISLLESSTKNQLLTYSILFCNEFEMEQIKDKYQIAFQELNKFQGNPKLNSMIFSAIEMRYSQILIGRYINQTRIIDVEHQDPVIQTTILEKQDSQQTYQMPQQLTQIKNQNKYNHKEDSFNKKVQTVTKSKQQSQRYLTKQDSLQVNLPQQWNKRAMQSGELSNTIQQSNQQNSNLFTQTSTVLITKPTQTSQQSVFRVVSSKHIDLNSSQQDMSSSFHSSQNEETPQSGQIQKTQQTQIQQQQILQQQPQDQINSVRKLYSQNEDSYQNENEQYNFHPIKNNMNFLSMYKNSLRMRTHIKESSRRQKLDQIQQIKFSIYDHNYTEFIDNIQMIPEMKLDTTFQNGNTFLIIAAQCGCIEIVHELIKRGSDLNIQNVKYYQRRMMAIQQYIQHWHMDIIRLQICQWKPEEVLIFSTKKDKMPGVCYDTQYYLFIQIIQYNNGSRFQETQINQQLLKKQSKRQKIISIKFKFSKICSLRTIKNKENSKYIFTYYCEQKKLTIKIKRQYLGLNALNQLSFQIIINEKKPMD
ncbi:unnamed protein product [Paramecium sonneborni]|uniref:Ankyrin repeat protein n=1 Tax=Paramecium sonneborni TaxID=65129 RepID=A0A8S1MVN7_9CILI|nr:unnamed protein product [Paramecium sonneborni]